MRISGCLMQFRAQQAIGQHQAADHAQPLDIGRLKKRSGRGSEMSTEDQRRRRPMRRHSINELTRGQQGAYGSYMRVRVRDGDGERSVAGTVFSDGRPRLIQIDGINLEAELGAHVLYTQNSDKPGYIGALGSILGSAGVNIASFSLGRDHPGGKAIMLCDVDEPVTDKVLEAIKALPQVVRVYRLGF